MNNLRSANLVLTREHFQKKIPIRKICRQVKRLIPTSSKAIKKNSVDIFLPELKTREDRKKVFQFPQKKLFRETPIPAQKGIKTFLILRLKESL